MNSLTGTRDLIRHGLQSVATAIGLLTLSATAQAPLDIRVALVIGNSAYAGAPLLNPVNDAVAMATTLRGLGFTVVELRDGQREQMAQAIAMVRDTLMGKQGVGMLYFAGHGLQLDWRNYMVPVDAKIESASDVAHQTVDVGAVIGAFRSAGSRMNILVLDACRDNPFGGITSGKGLAPVDAPPGTFLAYATAPGNVAEDGDVKTGNGLYTQFLLQELKKPATRIEDVFKRVRLQVRQRSQGRQIPWESTSLEEDFVFDRGVRVAARPEVQGRDQTFNQQRTEWDKIKESKNPDDFYEYLKKYPSGLVSDLAQYRLEQTQRAQIVAQADQGGVVQTAQINTYRDGDRSETIIYSGLTGLTIGRATTVIKQIGPDLFESISTGVSNAIFNRAGFVFKDGDGTFDPPWNVIPGGVLAVGKQSSGRSILTDLRGSKQWVDTDARIVARETINTALGTLDTFKVEAIQVYQNGVRAKTTYWYEAASGLSVKRIREVRRPNVTTPDIVIREVVVRSRAG